MSWLDTYADCYAKACKANNEQEQDAIQEAALSYLTTQALFGGASDDPSRFTRTLVACRKEQRSKSHEHTRHTSPMPLSQMTQLIAKGMSYNTLSAHMDQMPRLKAACAAVNLDVNKLISLFDGSEYARVCLERGNRKASKALHMRRKRAVAKLSSVLF